MVAISKTLISLATLAVIGIIVIVALRVGTFSRLISAVKRGEQ